MKNGYENEFDFINYLNNKKYKEVNILFQEILSVLFPNIKPEDEIIAYKYGRYAKVDMVISVNEIKKGISIKGGIKNSVHVEPIYKFILFLEKFGFDKRDSLLRYLYSDGTNNNSGTIRQSSEDYKKNHKEDIKDINKSLERIKYELLKRFLIETDINYKVKVDMFIVGYINDFFWITKHEVLEYLQKVDHESEGVHVSKLFIQNWNKNLKRNPKYEYCRSYIQVKWYSLLEDLMQILIMRKNNRL